MGKDKMRRYCHIVVAGGTGSRFGKSVPKQFALLCGKPVLMHTIERLRRWGRGGDVITAMSGEWMDYWRELCSEYGFEAGKTVEGGSTRWHSVKSALDTVGDDVDVVTVHDGARPLLSKGLMDRVLEALAGGNTAVVPVVCLRESLRMVEDNGGSIGVARSRFRLVQTPQGFDQKSLQWAYSQDYSEEFTDDASVAEAAGMNVTMVAGDEKNIKITYPADIVVAEYYMEREGDGSTAED